MEKRLFLAIALSFLIIFAFSKIFPARQQSDNRQAQPAPSQSIAAVPADVPVVASTQSIETQCVTQSNPLFDLILEQPASSIRSVSFKRYNNAAFDLYNSLKIGIPGVVFVESKTSESGFVNNYKSGEMEITQTFSFNSNYSNDLKVYIKNGSATSQSISLPILLGRFDFSQKTTQPANMNIQDITVAGFEKTVYPNPRKEAYFSGTNFLGMRNKYFAAIIDPVEQGFSAFIKPVPDNKLLVDVGLSTEQITLSPGQEREFTFKLYLGPQDVDILNSHNLSWASTVYYGKFNFFAHILLSALKVTHKMVRNWGIAIIIVSILIYLLLFPLTLKGFKTMRTTQELKPKIDQLQAQYKSDPQKLNREMMALYKEHKINPLSGCLPFMLQIPIFGAFFLVLSRLIEIKGASFLWIKDLAEPDRLFLLSSALPFIGKEINILPVVFLVISFIQQRFTPAASGASAEQQKIFMFMTPVILGVVFYHMPAGLLLYSCVNASLMVFQMGLMQKKS